MSDPLLAPHPLNLIADPLLPLLLQQAQDILQDPLNLRVEKGNGLHVNYMKEGKRTRIIQLMG